MYINSTADSAIARYGEHAPIVLAELIAAALRDGDKDLADDFDRILRLVQCQLELVVLRKDRDHGEQYQHGDSYPRHAL